MYKPSASSLISSHARFARGFTLLELLVTLSIAAILLAVAIPSYRSVIQRNTIAAAANDLIGDLNYARSEAVTRGQYVIVCQRADQQTCSTGDNDWSEGWIVYAPDPGSTAVTNNNRLRVRPALEAQVQIEGNDNITATVAFDANGFARKADDGSIGNGTFTISADNDVQATEVVISTSGRIRSQPATGDSS